jgi:UDP-N-acetyl-D-glucosamine dehydrogenase
MHIEESVAAYRPEVLSDLADSITERRALVGIIGLGYVGLPLAMCFAKRGFRVLGFDVSPNVVAGIEAGISHVEDISSEALAPMVERGLISATLDMSRLSECDAISICVPTPLSKTRDPDMSYVVGAAENVGRALRRGQLVILESTTYPGTTRDLVLPILERAGLVVGEDFFLCFSPERVDPGNTKWVTENTPKVIGGITPPCTEAGVALYSTVMQTIVPVSSAEVAELTKLLENTFRSVNIALVNELAQASERLGVDVWEVIDAAATKPFGYMKFSPGPGIGGHCIPLDPYYLSWKMKTLNYTTRLIELAGEINHEMPHFVVRKVQDALNEKALPLNGTRVLVLGVAYKKDVGDVRESPALDVIRLLQAKGVDVVYHDPYVARIDADDGRVLHSVALDRAELAAAQCVVVVTDHSCIDYREVADASSLVIDTRNAMAGILADHVIGLSGTAAETSRLASAPRVQRQIA